MHKIELKGKSTGVAMGKEKTIFLKFDGREAIDNKIITRVLVLF
jgi:peroxiredoxin family protein